MPPDALTHLANRPERPARVVVMGAGGFVGGAILRRLQKDDVPVLGLTHADVDLLRPDVADRLASLLRPKDVFVAVSAMAPCKNTDMLRDNIIMARAMTSAAARVDLAHVINISSDAIYADSSEPLTETSVAAPESLHGVMHLARELMFKADIKTPIAMLRPTLIYGPGDPHNGYGPNRFMRLAAKGEPIVLFGKGEERRDHVYIDDVAEIAARVVYHRSVGALNVATGVVTSFHDVARLCVELSGGKSPVQETPRVGPMPHNGYRTFDTTTRQTAFPDVKLRLLQEGLTLARSKSRTG